MAMEYSFNVKKIKVEEHVFFVIESNILKGCVAQGDTLDDALALFSELEREWLETAKKYDIPIPTELANIQPVSVIKKLQEHIKQRILETGFNNGGIYGEVAEDIADRIDIWVDEFRRAENV